MKKDILTNQVTQIMKKLDSFPMDLIEIRQNEIQKLYIICLEEGNIIETKIEKNKLISFNRILMERL
jgi:hypothetical protein